MTREEVIIDLNALKFILDNDQYTDEIEEALDTAIFVLQQPEPKKGRWIECDHDKWSGGTFAYRCSECAGAYHLNIEQTVGVWNFCPNCGADMKEGETDDRL